MLVRARGVLHVHELSVGQPVDDAGLGASADRALAGLGQRRDRLSGTDPDLLWRSGVQAVAGDRPAQVKRGQLVFGLALTVTLTVRGLAATTWFGSWYLA